MAKIALIDPLGRGLLWHRHFTRDWTGAYMPGGIAFPPLDLMYAAAYVRSRGHEARIYESSVKHYSLGMTVKMAAGFMPDIAVIPTTYFTLTEDKKLASALRQRIKGVKIVFAGPSVTYDPAAVLSDGSADLVALGELELPLADIAAGKAGDNVARLENGRVVCGERTLIDMRTIPIPARDLIDNQAYRYAIFNKRNPITAMSISRGCPHSKCKFCTSKLYTLGQVRYRSLDSIIQEMEEVAFKYRIGEVFFRDQTFTSDRALVSALCEQIIAKKIPLSWRVSTRVDAVDKGLLILMQRAGCYQISFGFESPTQKALDLNSKGISAERSRLAASWAKEAGIETVGLFMQGMWGDNEEANRRMADWAIELGVDYAQFNEPFLSPGTELFDIYRRDRSILMPKARIKKFAAASYLRFYLRPGYFKKQLQKIKSFSDVVFLVRCAVDEALSLL